MNIVGFFLLLGMCVVLPDIAAIFLIFAVPIKAAYIIAGLRRGERLSWEWLGSPDLSGN